MEYAGSAGSVGKWLTDTGVALALTLHKQLYASCENCAICSQRLEYCTIFRALVSTRYSLQSSSLLT